MLVGGGVFLGLTIAEGICRWAKVDRSRQPESVWGIVLRPHNVHRFRKTAQRQEGDPYIERHPTLGWTVRREGASQDGLYFSDERGLRVPAPKESETPRSATTASFRIAAFGDSFTHCDEVPYADSWPARLQEILGKQVEVMNAGVPGYGTDQAYLRYLHRADDLESDLVICGLAIADMKRNVNIIRALVGEWTSFTKPRFLLRGETLELVNSPAANAEQLIELVERRDPLLELDFWFDPSDWQREWLARSDLFRLVRSVRSDRQTQRRLYTATSEPTLVTAAIVKAFHRAATQRNDRFLCLIIPGRPRLKNIAPRDWQPLQDQLIEAGVPLLDPTEELHSVRKSPQLFAPNGHFRRQGNEILARLVAEWIGPEAVAPPTPR